MSASTITPAPTVDLTKRPADECPQCHRSPAAHGQRGCLRSRVLREEIAKRRAYGELRWSRRLALAATGHRPAGWGGLF